MISTFKTAASLMLSLVFVGTLAGCTTKTHFRSACAGEISVAWEELDIAKAKGFAGTISYTKAFSLVTAARTMQTVENFESCYRQAKDARFYIRQSYKGQ